MKSKLIIKMNNEMLLKKPLSQHSNNVGPDDDVFDGRWASERIKLFISKSVEVKVKFERLS